MRTASELAPRRGLSLLVVAGVAVAIVATELVAYGGRSATGPLDLKDPGFCAIARAFRSTHGRSPELHIVVTDIVFRGHPGTFVPGDFTVVAPVAAALPGLQDVLEVRGIPTPARVLDVEGNHAVAWPYPGTLHHDLRFTGIALVRRPAAHPVPPKAAPTHDSLPDGLRTDARLTSAQLDESHGLARCKAFKPWIRDTAGEPPFTEQVLRIARRVRAGIRDIKEPRRDEDICAALREGVFSHHQAQVLTVLATRELGIPSYGFTSTGVGYHAGVFLDGTGWVALDTSRPDQGFTFGGAPIVTKAPIVGSFEAAQDGFWVPNAHAYTEQMGRVRSRSRTRWSTQENDDDDTTVTRAVDLDEVCP